LWVAAESRRLIKQAGDVLAAHAVVDRNIDALVAEVVGHGQQLEAPTVDQAVAYKSMLHTWLIVAAGRSGCRSIPTKAEVACRALRQRRF